jgi:tripartite-type tricarboxylate transporter receptor subunit TctC
MLATAALYQPAFLRARSRSSLRSQGETGQLNVGSGGLGTTQHIVGEVFQVATGTKFVHVPYKGGGLAVADLVGGQIDLAFADMAPAVPHIKSGRLRALVVSSEQRSPTLPDVPTMAEAGVKGSFPQTWWAIAAPKGTPAVIINRLNAEIAQFMELPDVQEKLVNVGLFPLHSTPARVTELVKIGNQQMAKVVKPPASSASSDDCTSLLLLSPDFRAFDR